MRRWIAGVVCIWAALVVTAGDGPLPAAEEMRPNVLFIAVDDLGNVLGRTRPPGLQTPHLDRLAARGVFFERAYCQIPLCNPSRASVLTGRRPDQTTVWDLSRHFREQIPEVVTLPQLFRQSGWRTSRVGKIFHYNVPNGIGTNGLDDPLSWDEVINPRGRDVFDEALIVNPTPQRPISAAMSWLAAAGTDEEQTDGLIATEAVRLLEMQRDQPFFLGVGFFRPHTPYVAPRRYFEMYPLESIALPAVLPQDRDDIPTAAIPHNIPTENYGLPPETLREALRAYLASVSFIDAQVGRVLDALDRLGLADRTIVVLWSDHGYHLGERGLWQKRTLFDESARAPLLVAGPGVIARGEVCRRPVEFIDIYPTVVDLAGLARPAGLNGRSLRPLLQQPAGEWNHPAFTQILRPGVDRPVMGRSVTTGEWRYIEWDEGRAGRELYHHRNDPREQTNLADDERYRDRIAELRAAFEAAAIGGTVPSTPFDRSRL